MEAKCLETGAFSPPVTSGGAWLQGEVGDAVKSPPHGNATVGSVRGVQKHRPRHQETLHTLVSVEQSGAGAWGCSAWRRWTLPLRRHGPAPRLGLWAALPGEEALRDNVQQVSRSPEHVSVSFRKLIS